MANSEALLFRQFASIETSFDALLPTAEQSRRRLLNTIRAIRSGPSFDARHPSSGLSRIHLVGAGIVVALACFVLFTRVPEHHAPLAADDVLARAAGLEDNPRLDAAPGVIFRRVQVNAGGERLAWLVYRDTQGRRAPRFKLASASEPALLARLSAAGVTRADPLSVAAYRDWRNRLLSRTESTVRSSPGRITITTSLPQSEISAVKSESLTLRDNDYHAVSRTVEFRNAGSVEIAELEYQVLPWSQAGSDWFESDTVPSLPLHPAIAAVPSAPTPAPALSDTQLDLAELDARLILSRERADVADQVTVVRTPSGLLIQGLVSTPERKQELNTALASVANARAQLSTPEELAARERDDAVVSPLSHAPLKLIESVSTASPLLIDWTRQQRNPARLPETSSALLDSALRMAQQAHAMRELAHEFAAKPRLSGPAEEAYRTLLQDHATRLQAALADQSTLIAALAQESAPSAVQPAAVNSDSLLEDVDALDRAASRSLALCRELTAGQPSGQREAQPILHDLALQSGNVTVALDRVRHLQAPPQ